jgi:hypothetical protein
MRSEYFVLKGDKVSAQTSSLKKAKKWADEFERKYRTNCFVVKVMKR